MNLQLAITSCVVLAWTLSLSLCRPPTPRVVTAKDLCTSLPPGPSLYLLRGCRTAFDRVKQAVQMHNLSGLPSIEWMRDRWPNSGTPAAIGTEGVC